MARFFDRLAGVAAEQHGYVTQGDAHGLGVNSAVLVKMAQRGVLERVSFGLYRVGVFPRTRLGSYMEAVLWPVGVRAVISHQTALSLYELSDVNPARIDICVPVGHRPRREVPAFYRLHSEDLKPDEVTEFDAIPIVTAQKAILQAYGAGLGPALISQAIDDGYRKGYFNKAAAHELRAKVGLVVVDDRQVA